MIVAAVGCLVFGCLAVWLFSCLPTSPAVGGSGVLRRLFISAKQTTAFQPPHRLRNYLQRTQVNFQIARVRKFKHVSKSSATAAGYSIATQPVLGSLGHLN